MTARLRLPATTAEVEMLAMMIEVSHDVLTSDRSSCEEICELLYTFVRRQRLPRLHTSARQQSGVLLCDSLAKIISGAGKAFQVNGREHAWYLIILLSPTQNLNGSVHEMNCFYLLSSFLLR